MERSASNASSVSQREEITNLPYFHSKFKSTDEVANFIRKKAKKKAGHFLLRPSNRRRNLLTASVLVPDQTVRHTHVQIESIGMERYYFLVVEKKFTSIAELVEFYGRNPVKNLEGVQDVFLKNPIYREGVYYNSPNGGATSPSGQSMSSMGSFRDVQGAVSSPPPLPTRPRNMSTSSSIDSMSIDNSDGMSNSEPDLNASRLASRPPAPLPMVACTSIYPEEGVYYSRARDVDEDLTDRLKEVLKLSERCECGIARDMGELSLGWTVHRSKDQGTVGKLFYQNSDGVTSWHLPEEVRMQLTQKHMVNLQKLKSKAASTSRSTPNLTMQKQGGITQRSITQL